MKERRENGQEKKRKKVLRTVPGKCSLCVVERRCPCPYSWLCVDKEKGGTRGKEKA